MPASAAGGKYVHTRFVQFVYVLVYRSLDFNHEEYSYTSFEYCKVFKKDRQMSPDDDMDDNGQRGGNYREPPLAASGKDYTGPDQTFFGAVKYLDL
jgi:hypothetical protein